MSYNRKDSFYKQAKEDGFASRAAYKLKELQKQFKLIQKGDLVIELGAWPGGWTQVSLQLVGAKGRVIACDLKPIELEAPNLSFQSLDVFEEQTLKWLESESSETCSCVLSDMSPKITGVKFRDQALSGELAERCLDVAKATLREGGAMVVKIFPGPEEEDFNSSCREVFSSVKRKSLKSSRNTSSEIYTVCKGFSK